MKPLYLRATRCLLFFVTVSLAASTAVHPGAAPARQDQPRTGGLIRVRDFVSAPKPSLDVKLAPIPGLTLDLGASAEFRRFGRDSYAEGGSHPPLEEGSRRRERQLAASIEAGYEVTSGWTVMVNGKWLRKDSNMPDYVPGVYPASRQYSIDWDYTNWTASAGLRFEL